MKKVFFLLTVLCLFSWTGCSRGADPAPQPQPSGKDGNTTVIYEANPKLFAKSNALKSIEGNLSRLQELGVNVLWLMPIYEIGEKNAFGSPYCVKDYKKVNPAFGSVDDLKSLVKEAHGRGMRVILDFVANHTSWDNAWITLHPDWYTQEGGVIISPKGMGWPDVADLNYSSNEMRAAMKDAMLFWVREAGVDGYRCDYADGVPDDFWKDAIIDLRAVKGNDLLMLAESSQEGHYQAGFDMLYAWSYCGNLPRLFSGVLNWTSLRDIYKNEMSSTPSGKKRMRYTINHDTASSDGSPITLYKGEKGAMSAFVLSTFLEGVPMIYSSQEIGYSSTISIFEYKIMDWKSNSSYREEYRKVMKAYTSTASLRGNEPVLYNMGEIAAIGYAPSSSVKLAVFVNTTGTLQESKTPMELSGAKVTDLVSGKESTLPLSLSLPAYEYRIFEIK